MDEIWKPALLTASKYEVSNLGRIRRVNVDGTYTIKKITHRSMRYPKVSLSIQGREYIRSLPTMIAEVFVPNPFEFYRVIYKDGNFANNAASNLEWASDSDAGKHIYYARINNVLEQLDGKQ